MGIAPSTPINEVKRRAEMSIALLKNSRDLLKLAESKLATRKDTSTNEFLMLGQKLNQMKIKNSNVIVNAREFERELMIQRLKIKELRAKHREIRKKLVNMTQRVNNVLSLREEIEARRPLNSTLTTKY
jgi:hypothetical protein